MILSVIVQSLSALTYEVREQTDYKAKSRDGHTGSELWGATASFATCESSRYEPGLSVMTVIRIGRNGKDKQKDVPLMRGSNAATTVLDRVKYK
jgi:hypothetical protein